MPRRARLTTGIYKQAFLHAYRTPRFHVYTLILNLHIKRIIVLLVKMRCTIDLEWVSVARMSSITYDDTIEPKV